METEDLYPELKREILEIACSLTSVVSEPAHDFRHRSENEEILHQLEETLRDLHNLKNKLKQKIEAGKA